MNYLKTLDYRYVAQPVDDLLFPWEETGLLENLNTINEDENFQEIMTPEKTQPQHTPSKKPQPALRLLETLRKLSAARQLSD